MQFNMGILKFEKAAGKVELTKKLLTSVEEDYEKRLFGKPGCCKSTSFQSNSISSCSPYSKGKYSPEKFGIKEENLESRAEEISCSFPKGKERK